MIGLGMIKGKKKEYPEATPPTSRHIIYPPSSLATAISPTDTLILTRVPHAAYSGGSLAA